MEDHKELALAMKNEVAVSSASAMAIAEIRSSMQLAKMYPRDNNLARVNILDTCRRPGFAPHLCYGKPIGNKVIPGISIRGAEVAANCWGNIKSMSGIVYDDENKRIVNIVSMDLQTNTSYSSQVVVDRIIERSYLKNGQIKIYERQNSKGDKVYGVTPTTDEFEVKVAAQISKQMRNNILRLIPEDIKEEMVIVAKKTMEDRAAEDPQGEIKNIVDAFSSLRVMPNDLKDFLGHDVGKCSPTQVAELRVMYKSIKDGQATWKDYLPEIIDDQNGKTKKKTDKLKDDLKPDKDINDSDKNHSTAPPKKEEKKSKTAKPKETKPQPPKATKTKPEKNSSGESPATKRDRVITLVKDNPGLREELLKRVKALFPEYRTESFLDLEMLKVPEYIPDKEIQQMDSCFRDAGLYK